MQTFFEPTLNPQLLHQMLRHVSSHASTHQPRTHRGVILPSEVGQRQTLLAPALGWIASLPELISTSERDKIFQRSKTSGTESLQFGLQNYRAVGGKQFQRFGCVIPFAYSQRTKCAVPTLVEGSPSSVSNQPLQKTDTHTHTHHV